MQIISVKQDMIVYAVNTASGYEQPKYVLRYTDAGQYSYKIVPGQDSPYPSLDAAESRLNAIAKREAGKYGFTQVPKGKYVDAPFYEPDEGEEPLSPEEYAALISAAGRGEAEKPKRDRPKAKGKKK
jgi:hypothetical protein